MSTTSPSTGAMSIESSKPSLAFQVHWQMACRLVRPVLRMELHRHPLPSWKRTNNSSPRMGMRSPRRVVFSTTAWVPTQAGISINIFSESRSQRRKLNSRQVFLTLWADPFCRIFLTSIPECTARRRSLTGIMIRLKVLTEGMLFLSMGT